MNRVAGRAGITIVLAIALLAGFVFFLCEYAANAGSWVFQTGSPHVYDAENIGCGVVTDTDGALLLDLRDGRVYAPDTVLRMATVHWLGDRDGMIYAPALSKYAKQLAGYNMFSGVYSYGGTGGVAELSLSAKVQAAALEALGSYKGTIGVYNYKTGELICAVSTPTHDPDNPPDIAADTEGKYEGVYQNRFTQSVYIPGSIFKVVTLAAALECDPTIVDMTFECTGSRAYGDDMITCESVHFKQTLQEAFRNSCNCAFAQIADRIGADVLQRYVEQFGITSSISFDGITTAEGNFDLRDAASVSVAWSAIGQYTDQINVCRFMTFVGAIAAGGVEVQPHLVNNIKVDGLNTYTAQTTTGERIMSQNTAQIVKAYMQANVTEKYGEENFAGFRVCAKTGTAEVGGEKKPNAMLTGFIDDTQYPLAFIVAVEDGGYGRAVCVPIIEKVLQACKAS